MKIAIVEDEYLASSYLKSILEQQDILQIAEIAVLKSVKEAVAFFLKIMSTWPLWIFI